MRHLIRAAPPASATLALVVVLGLVAVTVPDSAVDRPSSAW